MAEHKLRRDQIREFETILRTEERTAATIEKYLRDIRGFAAWLEGRYVSKETASEWKSCLISSGLAPSTVNAKLSALNKLLRFLGWEECRVKFLKVQRRVFRDESRELTRADYDRLLSAARENGDSWLELLMETICATGVRVSEVKYITVKSAMEGRTDISLKGKIRTILLPGKLCRKLLKYAEKKKIVSGEIFLTRDGKVLTRYQIWREMKKICTKARVQPTKVFPHNLRHLFASTFYRVTHDIVKLADVLGHSSINTTRIYLLTTGAEHSRQLERLGLVS